MVCLSSLSTGAMQAPSPTTVGVKKGDWVKYSFNTTFSPWFPFNPAWTKFEILSVDGDRVQVQATAQLVNGSERSEGFAFDVGQSNEWNISLGDLPVIWLDAFLYPESIIIPSNRTLGDNSYKRTYGGVSRTVVDDATTGNGYEEIWWWDEQTGFLMQDLYYVSIESPLNNWTATEFNLPLTRAPINPLPTDQQFNMTAQSNVDFLKDFCTNLTSSDRILINLSVIGGPLSLSIYNSALQKLYDKENIASVNEEWSPPYNDTFDFYFRIYDGTAQVHFTLQKVIGGGFNILPIVALVVAVVIFLVVAVLVVSQKTRTRKKESFTSRAHSLHRQSSDISHSTRAFRASCVFPEIAQSTQLISSKTIPATKSPLA